MTRRRIPLVETVEDARLRPGVFPVAGRRPLLETTADRLNERIYCVSCHHAGGFITRGIDGVIYLCDRFSPCGCDCQGTKGELPLPRLAI